VFVLFPIFEREFLKLPINTLNLVFRKFIINHHLFFVEPDLFFVGQKISMNKIVEKEHSIHPHNS